MGESILGTIVRVRPEFLEQTIAQIEQQLGMEIMFNSGDGRLIVVIEDTPTTSAAQSMAAMSLMEGVLNTSLVYEFTESESPLTSCDCTEDCAEMTSCDNNQIDSNKSLCDKDLALISSKSQNQFDPYSYRAWRTSAHELALDHALLKQDQNDI